MVSSGGSYKWPYGGSINVTRDIFKPDIKRLLVLLIGNLLVKTLKKELNLLVTISLININR